MLASPRTLKVLLEYFAEWQRKFSVNHKTTIFILFVFDNFACRFNSAFMISLLQTSEELFHFPLKRSDRVGFIYIFIHVFILFYIVIFDTFLLLCVHNHT